MVGLQFSLWCVRGVLDMVRYCQDFIVMRGQTGRFGMGNVVSIECVASRGIFVWHIWVGRGGAKGSL